MRKPIGLMLLRKHFWKYVYENVWWVLWKEIIDAMEGKSKAANLHRGIKDSHWEEATFGLSQHSHLGKGKTTGEGWGWKGAG